MIHMVSTEVECSKRKIHRVIREISEVGAQNGLFIRLIFSIYRAALSSYSWQAF